MASAALVAEPARTAPRAAAAPPRHLHGLEIGDAALRRRARRVTSGAAVGAPVLERPAAKQQTADGKRGAGPLEKQAGLVAEADPRLRREGNG
jgi:hypothetical protein